jgi:hypothetical protein
MSICANSKEHESLICALGLVSVLKTNFPLTPSLNAGGEEES